MFVKSELVTNTRATDPERDTKGVVDSSCLYFSCVLVCSEDTTHVHAFRSYIEKVSYPHYLEVLHVQGKIKLYSLHSYLKKVFVQVLSCRVIITIWNTKHVRLDQNA